jgi:hypothetical protein
MTLQELIEVLQGFIDQGIPGTVHCVGSEGTDLDVIEYNSRHNEIELV